MDLKEFNKTLTTIAAAAMAIGTLVPVAFAASTSSTIGGRKAISVNNSVVSNPYTRVANDAGNATSYIGVWYLGQAVKTAGGDYAWDPATKTFSMNIPGIDGAALAAKIPNGVGTGNTTLVVNGVTVKKVNSFAAQDPAGSKSDITTYMPLFYMGEIFGELGGSSWDGNTFSFTKFQDKASSLTVTGSATGDVALGQNDNFTVAGTDASGNSVQIPSGQVTWSANGGTIDQNGNFTASTPGTYTITASYNGTSATATVDYGLFVKNATAINGGQLLVKFSQSVDKATAQTTSNYALTDASGVVKLASGGAALQADGQSVVLTLATPVQNSASDDITVTINKVGALNNAASTIPVFSSTVHVADTTAPTVASVVADPTSSSSVSGITVNFSEPVQSGIVKIDGMVVAIPATETSIHLTGLTLDPAKAHTIQIVNLKDMSGNVGQINQSFSVSTDKSAPVVTSVVANGDHALLVTFSKVVSTASVVSAITVEDETGTPTKLNLGTIAKYANDTTGNATSGTQFVVPITSTLYSSSVNSRTLTVVFADKKVTDEAGNTLAGTTRTVTLNKDTTAPTITGLSYVTDKITGNVTDVVATFSESVATANKADVTVTDSNGVLEPSAFLDAATVFTTDNTKIDFQLATPAALSGVYTFNFAKGTAADEAQVANDSAAYMGTVDFGAPKVSTSTFSLASVTSANTPNTPEVITVNFGTAVKGGNVAGSATNPADYTLDGQALPAGTTITLNAADQPAGSTAQTIATITLPANSIAISDSAAVFTVNNVQDTNGDTINAYTGTVGVIDNTAPVLNGATFNADGTLSLAFSENVTTPDAADYSISVNNGDALATTAYTATAGSGADAGKVVIKFTGVTINNGDTVAIKSESGSKTVDADGVQIASGTTVSVIK
jgi:hypothetical protein